MCGMSLCDLETSTMRLPRPDWGCCATKINVDGSSYPRICEGPWKKTKKNSAMSILIMVTAVHKE